MARSRVTRSEASRVRVLALVLLAALAVAVQAAPIVAVDDAGRELRLERPPARIVTLAPSLTELVFAAGGGPTIVAVDSSSDFPPAAQAIPRIGDVARIDVERLLALKPDLVLVWRHGNTTRELDQLEAAGLRLFRLEPQRLDDVVRAIERLGQLLGTEATAGPAAAALRERLAALRKRHASDPPVRVFYQVWSSPLMTISRKQIVSEVIELCGGRNVFAGLRRWCRRWRSSRCSPPTPRRSSRPMSAAARRCCVAMSTLPPSPPGAGIHACRRCRDAGCMSSTATPSAVRDRASSMARRRSAVRSTRCAANAAP